MMDICFKIWCWLRALTRAEARGITSTQAEELTEEIDEEGIRVVACDCGTGRDWIEYIQKVFMRLFECTSTNLWIQQARCLSQA